MIEPRIEKMIKAARGPVVALAKYNKLRSRAKDDLVFVFEGNEDPIFYFVATQRSNVNYSYKSLVVHGKDMVLGLRKLLSESIEAEKGCGVAFFIDSDFDGLKNSPPGNDIYITPTYSIENIICSTKTLENLLELEFKLHDDDQFKDIENLVKIYENTLENFYSEMKNVNLLIYFGRTKSNEACGSNIISIEEKSNAFFKLDKNSLTVTCLCKDEKVKDVVKFDNDFDMNLTALVSDDFNKLDPHTHWRGKFCFSLFVQIVQTLVEDRNCATPKFFSKGKGKVKLNLATDSAFRILSTACEIPSCLINFLQNVSVNALH